MLKLRDILSNIAPYHGTAVVGTGAISFNVLLLLVRAAVLSTMISA